MSLVAGLLTSLLTMSADHSYAAEPHIVAAFLVLIGLGLRIEAAIADRRP